LKDYDPEAINIHQKSFKDSLTKVKKEEDALEIKNKLEAEKNPERTSTPSRRQWLMHCHEYHP